MRLDSKPYNRLIHGVNSCIFCGNSPTTKEHLWPKYVRQFEERQRAGRPFKLQHAVVTAVSVEESQFYSSTLRPRGVEGVSITLKALCSRCNDRFSRNIQIKCRNELLEIMSRRTAPTYIPSNAMLRWILLFTMCCSFDTNHYRTISTSTLYNFRTGTLPKNFKVYYRYSDESCPILSYDRRFQHEVLVSDVEVGPFSDTNLIVSARQSFTLSLGSVMFYVLSHESLVADYNKHHFIPADILDLTDKYQLSELWPVENKRQAFSMNLQEMNSLSDELHGPEHIGKFRGLNDASFVPTHV